MSKYSAKKEPAACTAKEHNGERCAHAGTKLAWTIAGLRWHCTKHYDQKIAAGDPHNPNK